MADSQISPEELEALRARTWRSPVEFARIFLPEWFPSKMPWVHRGLLALITGKTEFLLDFGTEVWQLETASWTMKDLEKVLTNFITEEGDRLFHLDMDGDRPEIKIAFSKRKHAFIMPRGYSKTTLMNLANLVGICYKVEDFFMYISETVGHASEQLSTIKKELEENDLLRLVFGDLVAPRQASNKWTEILIEPTNGTRVAVVGRGGQVRGKNKGAKRPARLIFDDLQDEESVDSEEQLKKDSRWFFRSATPALRKGGQVFVIGTLLAGESVPTILNKLLSNREYACVRFSGIDRQGEALWANQFGNGYTLEQLEEMRQIAIEMGELEGYYLEYESRHVSDDAKTFPRSKMIRVSKELSRFVSISLVVDPAIGTKKTSDFCAFAVIGIEAGGTKHVIHTEGKKAMPFEDQVDKFFELHFRYLAHLPPEFQRHGVESIAYQKALHSTIKTQQFVRSRETIEHGPFAGQIAGTRAYFEVEPIMHGKTGKDQRIKGILKPLYHAGNITFERVFPELESQLFDYPTGKDDFPDVLAMAVKQLDPFAALGAGDEADLAKDTAEPLDAMFGRFAS